MASRRLLSAFVALVPLVFLGPGLSFADEPAKDGGVELGAALPLAEEIKAISQAHADRHTRFMDELHEAKQDREKVTKSNETFRADVKALDDRLVVLLAANQDAPEFLDGILVMVGELRYPIHQKLLPTVMEKHLQDPRMAKLCPHLEYRTREPWAEKILLAVADGNPDPLASGRAKLALGEYYRHKAFPYGETLTDEQRAPLIAQAREYYETVANDYRDTSCVDDDITLGTRADWELIRLANVPNLKPGMPAPEISGEDMNGVPMKLSDYRGKVTVVVFWGSWCGPCMRMVPHEKELFERYHDKPFAIVGVNCGDELETARETVAAKEMSWRHWRDRSQTRRGPVQIAYDVQHWPTVWVIDREGTIRYFDVRDAKLDSAIEELLAETN
ncbi:MAG TPA: TlpA disulfide reductase family protein [Pirellulales bacterium]|nr:TlpA disulfide reductase family protein [Pirellulales bacterium]